MATQNRLRATIESRHDECLEELSENVKSRPHAERVAVKEGLAALGYVEKPAEPHEQLLWHVRRAGLLLGFVGLIAIGYGVFGPRVASLVGFGLTLGGFLLVALEEFLDEYSEAFEGAL